MVENCALPVEILPVCSIDTPQPSQRIIFPQEIVTAKTSGLPRLERQWTEVFGLAKGSSFFRILLIRERDGWRSYALLYLARQRHCVYRRSRPPRYLIKPMLSLLFIFFHTVRDIQAIGDPHKNNQPIKAGQGKTAGRLDSLERTCGR